MTNEAFQTILEGRIDAMRKTLASKAKEYAGPTDRLHNFKDAHEIEGVTAADACRGMLLKHWVSIRDMVKGVPSTATINEKIGDAINYLVLLEAILKETDALPR